MKKKELIKRIEIYRASNKYKKAVKLYAIELLDNWDIEEIDRYYPRKELNQILLNGAKNWYDYSEGFCSLYTNLDIQDRILTKTEAKRMKDIDYIALQAMALQSAVLLIRHLLFVNFIGW